ncbi:hypothetical protein [uncultured Stenotrophomonas sp.]|uniref:hypothetical protein n=1 Tax=uncultured Stenotrophomonas sp. TaxID=165438 RepID=UPI0025FC756B|nr:hypothetical protein [uncultured Stenotrophomonas sp.]
MKSIFAATLEAKVQAEGLAKALLRRDACAREETIDLHCQARHGNYERRPVRAQDAASTGLAPPMFPWVLSTMAGALPSTFPSGFRPGNSNGHGLRVSRASLSPVAVSDQGRVPEHAVLQIDSVEVW